ncbi:MAG TPA: ATP-binding cassette domain-containing protein, partial [Nitrososphaeraceae archaeon]|nr:ATP-binding cassette domain-containing protein [Nitrososphaeraceae archaeon]
MSSKRGLILKSMTKDLVVEKSIQNETVDNNSFALRVENLSKIYDSAAGRVVALDKINFSIKKGEFVSIVGPSGSGKSTVLNMVGALDRPTSGKIYIDGIDI